MVPRLRVGPMLVTPSHAVLHPCCAGRQCPVPYRTLETIGPRPRHWLLTRDGFTYSLCLPRSRANGDHRTAEVALVVATSARCRLVGERYAEMSLAKKIVQLRKERNLTQKELASIVGVHFSHLSRYERGLSLPSVEVVKKMAQLFHVSTDYLLFEDGQAPVRVNSVDVTLWRQFEQLAPLSESDKAVVKTVLESMLLKHHLEGMLGGRFGNPPTDAPEACTPAWLTSHPRTPSDDGLFQQLTEVLEHPRRTRQLRRRSTPGV